MINIINNDVIYETAEFIYFSYYKAMLTTRGWNAAWFMLRRVVISHAAPFRTDWPLCTRGERPSVYTYIIKYI